MKSLTEELSHVNHIMIFYHREIDETESNSRRIILLFYISYLFYIYFIALVLKDVSKLFISDLEKHYKLYKQETVLNEIM